MSVKINSYIVVVKYSVSGYYSKNNQDGFFTFIASALVIWDNVWQRVLSSVDEAEWSSLGRIKNIWL